MVLFSAGFQANTGVLVGTGGIVLASTLLGMFPQVKEYLPTMLMDGNSLIYGTAEPRDYVAAVAVSIALGIACFAAGIFVFNKKQL